MFETNIFLDLDGVILDSEARLGELKKKSNISSWRRFSEKIDWFDFLKECHSINNSVEIVKELEILKRKIAILTKFHTMQEAEAKTYELRHNRGIYVPIFFAPSHTKKSQIYFPVNKEILIDDSIKNVEDWTANGGQGILFNPYSEYENDIRVKSLAFLLKE